MTDIISEWKKSIHNEIDDKENENKEITTSKEIAKHIPLIAPIKEKHEFANPDEFDAYYQEHKDELDEKTTHKLNKMFTIPGYRITKIKGVLSLKNIPESRVTTSMRLDTLEEKTNEMKDRLNLCINTINKLLDYYQK